MFDPKKLKDIDPGTDINDLDGKRLRYLQRALSWMTYPISKVDGLIGPNTRNAHAEFKMDIGEGCPEIVSKKSRRIAIERVAETQNILEMDVSSKKATRKAIAVLCRHMGIGLKPQIAYVWATAQWETAHIFEPVKEAFWLSENWRKRNLRYYPYYGRGYVQLTWKRNYQNYEDVLAENLVGNPDLALDKRIALFVLAHGFKLGTFTGRRIEQYININNTDFRNARRCINGLDRWSDIMKIAEDYLKDM
ncbi:MAG: carboxypeptidase [Hyphomicrobiales bacterium]|nr:carboxypeptidase [Hyphomicrobiales bacterium]MCP4998876.1 carboxypeptidase [Hyphomicrobiales bacterium]